MKSTLSGTLLCTLKINVYITTAKQSNNFIYDYSIQAGAIKMRYFNCLSCLNFFTTAMTVKILGQIHKYFSSDANYSFHSYLDREV